MSIFKDKINKAKKHITNIQQDMCYFSRQLQRAMGLSDADLRDAQSEHIHWDIEGFTICVNVHPWNEWKPILQAVPLGIDGTMVGYSNTKEGESIPSSWHYEPKGTSTVFLPPEKIQEIILDRTRKMK